MKKLILKRPDFKDGEVLTRSQLKKVLGGDGSGSGGSGTVKKKCCYTNPTGCSVCVDVPAGSSASCPSGGTLSSC